VALFRTALDDLLRHGAPPTAAKRVAPAAQQSTAQVSDAPPAARARPPKAAARGGAGKGVLAFLDLYVDTHTALPSFTKKKKKRVISAFSLFVV
jgi:hypothetical protein